MGFYGLFLGWKLPYFANCMDTALGPRTEELLDVGSDLMVREFEQGNYSYLV